MVLLLREEVHSAGSAGMTMPPILFIHKVCSLTGYTKQMAYLSATRQNSKTS